MPYVLDMVLRGLARELFIGSNPNTILWGRALFPDRFFAVGYVAPSLAGLAARLLTVGCRAEDRGATFKSLRDRLQSVVRCCWMAKDESANREIGAPRGSLYDELAGRNTALRVGPGIGQRKEGKVAEPYTKLKPVEGSLRCVAAHPEERDADQGGRHFGRDDRCLLSRRCSKALGRVPPARPNEIPFYAFGLELRGDGESRSLGPGRPSG
jgi:hypothetical protein